MSYSLRTLEAKFMKTVRVETSEIESDPTHEGCVGKFVFRDESGDKFMWGPKNYRFEFHRCELAEADQISFLCPACFAKNGGAKGTHGVFVSFAGRNVPNEAGSRDSTGKPSRWTIVSGTGLDDLCLSPSILLGAGQKPEVGCHWHGFVGSSGIAPGHAG